MVRRDLALDAEVVFAVAAAHAARCHVLSCFLAHLLPILVSCQVVRLILFEVELVFAAWTLGKTVL